MENGIKIGSRAPRHRLVRIMSLLGAAGRVGKSESGIIGFVEQSGYPLRFLSFSPDAKKTDDPNSQKNQGRSPREFARAV